jgi:hypothetical protein
MESRRLSVASRNDMFGSPSFLMWEAVSGLHGFHFRKEPTLEPKLTDVSAWSVLNLKPRRSCRS